MLSGLKYVAINNNNIHSIQNYLQDNSTVINVVKLYLSNNKLEYLNVNSFYLFNKLEYLYLSNNILACINPLIFSNLPALSSLDLRGN